MSTRANILLTDGDSRLWFYRHSDGYPEGAMPLLRRFMAYLNTAHIRNNLGQAAGWLIVLGHAEHGGQAYGSGHLEPGDPKSALGWKVGSIEPTTEEHGDIDYRYTIDVAAKRLTCEKVKRDYGTPPVWRNPKVSYEVVKV